MSRANGSLHFKHALLPEGWRRNVRLSWRAGTFAAVVPETAPSPDDERHAIGIPGVANLHSHAFQRAMSGLAERRGTGTDTFWSWRETMYRFALSMTPDQMEAVAAQAYAEMLEAGFTRVGEFHYLHHDRDGRPYADVCEMAQRVAAAAGRTQIGLTLLPVFYAHSGFGGAAPLPAQRRFICDLDQFALLLERAEASATAIDGASVGLAPHSLRAVTPEELAHLAKLRPRAPIHIHAAEQTAEVEACLGWSGRRPVEYLLDQAAIDARWCLVHATHMTGAETQRLAASGAVAGLCPITEANLGDGIFNGRDYCRLGGRVGIGTDSNVQIGLADELRLLEYGQRLALRARSVVAAPGGSTGRALLEAALRGGAQALGRPGVGFAIGADADIVTLRSEALELAGRDGDDWLDGWIFSGGSLIDCVYARGSRVVADGQHIDRTRIHAEFRATMLQLLAA